MKISELPTPRLRARAMELALEGYNTSEELDEAFSWGDTREGRKFWAACDEGNWDKAKELQPSLFKPVGGKPHIKLQGIYGLGMDNDEALFLGYALDSVTEIHSVNLYLLEVQPRNYSTIQEAVQALYSFKREENYELFKVDDLELCWKYIQEVDPGEHTTIKEAVEALYSFKREENL